MLLKERVVENRLIGNPAQGIYKLVLSGQIAKSAQPGQFVHIQVAETCDPLLRRPLSIALIDRIKQEVTIYYRVAGKGTDLLTRVKENNYLSVMGPLGTGFSVPREGELLLVAGGIGVFPLFSLLNAIDRSKVKVKLFWGGEHKAFLESADLAYVRTMEIDLEVSTLDGSFGYKGLVTEPFEAYIKSMKVSEKDQKEPSDINKTLRVAACGPKGMLRAVADLCNTYYVRLEVSLEERMACGIGACLGCVCTVKDEAGEVKRKRVCKEGPVLNGEEVIWDAQC